VTLTARSQLGALLALLLLTALSVALSYAPSTSLPIAIAIAASKAAIVAVFFMGLRTAGWGALAALISAASLLIVLITFIVLDLATR
jgi:cytochrome c oxidase subunit IV